MQLAPIALFVYKRPWHTQRVVEALLRNEFADKSDLIVFSDGPRTDADKAKVEEVREYIQSISGFKSIQIHKSDSNKGLANSIIGGLYSVLQDYERIIVLEDDLVTSPYFLTYMNQGLELYANEDDVISIHGYMYPVKGVVPETFFIKGADCWGWATWRRGWAHFEKSGSKLLEELKSTRQTLEFNFAGAFPFTDMLSDQIKGKNDSWAIRWQASAFLKKKLTLYPQKSLVQNIGFDVEATNTKASANGFQIETLADHINIVKQQPVENLHARNLIATFFRAGQRSFLVSVAILAVNFFGWKRYSNKKHKL